MNFVRAKELTVWLDLGSTPSRKVGRLADTRAGVLFEYDDGFVRSGLELSPFRLPLRPSPLKLRLKFFFSSLAPRHRVLWCSLEHLAQARRQRS